MKTPKALRLKDIELNAGFINRGVEPPSQGERLRGRLGA